MIINSIYTVSVVEYQATEESIAGEWMQYGGVYYSDTDACDVRDEENARNPHIKHRARRIKIVTESEVL